MLQDYHLYHDSLNNKVLLSSNRQKQALFDKYIIAQIPGNYYSLDTACHSSFGLVAMLYPTRNISGICAIIYIYRYIAKPYLEMLSIYVLNITKQIKLIKMTEVIKQPISMYSA